MNSSAPDKPPTDQTSHVFWLFDWGTNPVYTSLRYYPLYARCDIDHNGISIYSKNSGTIAVSYDQITSCNHYKFVQSASAGVARNLKITLFAPIQIKQNTKPANELFLVPADVFKHNPKSVEIDEMLQIISAYKEGQEPTNARNPYEREMRRLGKLNEFDKNKWDAYVPPSTFSPVPSLRTSIFKLLLIALVGTAIFVSIVGLIFNLLN